MDLGIKGKWALVGGASKGLGYGCAQALAKEGVNVVIVARGKDALLDAATRLKAECPGVDVVAVPVDITTPEGRAAIFAERKDYDIVVTNAGGPPPGDFRTWDREAWIKAVDANMLTPIELIKATIDGMAARGYGRIVNITSSAVKAPIDILGLSNGARSGLTGFVAGLARNPQIASKGVTLNNLLPGAFDTDRLRVTMVGASQKTGKPVEDIADARRQTIPAQRFGTPAEFGAICAFLCSMHAGYINGQNVLADGGAYPGTY
ncbi:SDR family NAD(P)-dependent oxidoreductase [Hylemonella gracilis]|uniref:SDR family NAD(P)-dependent oxidoreductase n=1 Tax=Hylemonella gracilis TaxID=80880 RepID=A0A4P6UII3_9BURK|nr:SDR family oxidoreductase [Hylemonella gracilis]QBK04793.1 SDR family NAD(P)-dependent oxidoreductase [Hylemonella gracilis]